MVVLNDYETVSEEEYGVIKYVAGAIGRSICRVRKCVDCKTCLVQDRLIDVEDAVEDPQAKLITLADRGGLVLPTELCFTFCVFIYAYYLKLSSDEGLFKKLLQCKNQQYVF